MKKFGSPGIYADIYKIRQKNKKLTGNYQRAEAIDEKCENEEDIAEEEKTNTKGIKLTKIGERGESESDRNNSKQDNDIENDLNGFEGEDDLHDADIAESEMTVAVEGTQNQNRAYIMNGMNHQFESN